MHCWPLAELLLTTDELDELITELDELLGTLELLGRLELLTTLDELLTTEELLATDELVALDELPVLGASAHNKPRPLVPKYKRP